jgi:hypothetical protein
LVVSVKCLACGKPHEMGHCSPSEYAFCDSACEKLFNRVVDGLESRVPPDWLGASPGDRVYQEAQREISRREARGLWQARARLEIDYYETLPRRRASVAKRYFSF